MDNQENVETQKNIEEVQEQPQNESEQTTEEVKDSQGIITSEENKTEETVENSNNVEETKPSDSGEVLEQEKPIQEEEPVSKESNEETNAEKTIESEEKQEDQPPQVENADNSETEKKTEQIENVDQEVQEVKETEEEKRKEDFGFYSAIEDGMKLLEYVLPIEKWNLDNTNNGIKIYSRLDESTNLKMTRGEGVIFKPANMIRDILMDPSATLKWEGSLIENNIVEKTDDYTIIKSLDQKRTLVAQRETLILIKDIVREDGSILVLERSIEHPSHPTKQDCVRAFVHLWACILIPDKEDPNKTGVTFIIFIDPKGWVPKTLFNAVVNGQAMNVQKLKTYVEKL